MLQFAKSAVLSTLRRLGYALVRIPVDMTMASQKEASYCIKDMGKLDQLTFSHTMRQLHARDGAEMEALYRHFVFPNIPDNQDRARLLYELIGTTIGEGMYVIEFLHSAMQAHGDVCEFGVAQGATSRLIANEIISSDRNLWLFDSFEGLPEPTAEDRLIHDIFSLGSIGCYKGTMASPETEVLSKLQSIDFPAARTKIKKGWVKDTTKSGDLPRQVAFAYVDLDFYEPIKDALDFLDTRMPIGGRIVVDDYGFFSEGAQLAVDRFVQQTAGRYTFELPLPFAGHFCMLSKVASA